MSYTFPSPTIPISNVKVSWKEQYGSSGFNKKLAGIIPSGIYRGLTLATSGSNNTVTVVANATYNDHLAVCENVDGFSLTFRDATGATYSLALTDASLLSQTVVITFFANYEEGQVTTANFIGYTLSDYNALSAAVKRELVVLGTVVNPAAGNLIISSAITQDRRTIANFNQSLLTWRPLIQNPSFERAPTGQDLIGLQAEGWSTSGSWQVNSADPFSGTRNAEFIVGGAGTYSEFLRQMIGVGVVAGQRVLVKGQKKVVGAASSGTATIELGFIGAGGGSPSTLSSSFVITSTDGSYQPISAYFVVPAGAIELKYIGIQVTSAVYAGSGSKIRIDTLTALLEPSTVDDQLNALDERLRIRSAAGLVVEDVNSTSFSDLAALITFKKGSPTASEGEVVIGRKDAGIGNAPALSQPGRIINIGSSLVSTPTDALLPRISGPTSTAMAATYTLLAEWTPSGNKPSRIYLGPTGEVILTKNLVWDDADQWWNKTIAGGDAGLYELNADNLQALNLANMSALNVTMADANVLASNVQTILKNQTYDLVFRRQKSAKSDVFNLAGRLQRYGQHYYDDFYDALDTNLYTTAGSSVTTDIAVTTVPNTLAVISNPMSSNSYCIGQKNLGSWSNTDQLAMLMRFKFVGPDANAIRTLGLGYFSGPTDTLGVGIYQSNNTSNLFVKLGSGTTHDTGWAPTMDTWYHVLFLSYPGSNIFPPGGTAYMEYWISTTEDFNDGGIVLTGSTNHITVGYTAHVIYPYFQVNTAVATSALLVDYYEVWSNRARS